MKFYSNEIVFRGHPDKVCDQISGAILNELVRQDKNTRAGIEVLFKNEKVIIAGEITSNAIVDYQAVAKRVLKDIGYTEEYKIGFELSKQSNDIAKGVNKLGAGDNGMMFGYACNDTPQYLPKAMVMLQELSRSYDKLVHTRRDLFHPDGKAQITGQYDGEFKLIKIKTFTVCYCQPKGTEEEGNAIIKKIIYDLCKKYEVEFDELLINPTGSFNVGGSFADAGLTGRKIVVDAYQSFANVGGGCMNGKDATKVDFSGAHKARELAKTLVHLCNLKWCEVQLSYAIGLEKPLAIYIDSDRGNIDVPSNIYDECKPAVIIKELGLLDADYEELAKFGHFTC